MAIQIVIDTSDHSFQAIAFNINYFREISELTALATSPIKTSLITFSISMFMERSSDSLFADAFADSSKKLDLTVRVRAASNSADEIITYSISSAQCVQYAVNFQESTDPAAVDNGVVLIGLIASQITVGNAPFNVGQ
jgi:hypothetical protein